MPMAEDAARPVPPPHAPLRGTRVLDVSMFLSGPFACHQLADLGAEVIKVEPPGGDPSRRGSLTADALANFHFVALQGPRTSVVLDLKNDAARGVFYDLAAISDVVVQNFRPGVAERLGVAYPDVQRVAPAAVYCQITGAGSAEVGGGPAIDGVIQALGGALELTGTTTTFGLPTRLTTADLVGGTMAVSAIAAALLRRERTGEGAFIDLSMVECLLQWIQLADRDRLLDPPATQLVEAADGVTLLVQAPMHFQAKLLSLVCDVGGRPLLEDPRFATPAAMRAHKDDFAAILREAFATRPSTYWLDQLAAAGVPAMQVLTMDEAMNSELIERRGAASTVRVPHRGEQRVMLSPFVVDGERTSFVGPPHALGEDTADTLTGLLGYDADRLAQLAAAGAFGPNVAG